MKLPDFSAKGPTPCSTADPEAFFPDIESVGSLSRAQQAKKLCSSCVYSVECLAWALERNEPGVWGGTTAGERIKMKRARRSSLYAA